MTNTARMARAIAALLAIVSAPAAQDWNHRVLAPGKLPADARLDPPRKLDDANHPWTPPTSFAKWERQAEALRQRILVSTGLWPRPAHAPLEPVVFGRIERDDYTVDKVYFASRPGHYVTGNLYRPKPLRDKMPGVLSPHGHKARGRMHDAGPEVAKRQIESGAEELEAAARHPVQARLVQLARMGCVVFNYDMVGYASSQKIGHGKGFSDLGAELQLQSAMGLQTWNSIRALDFLMSLPSVDREHIGVTGASGGGTQTFILCAIDNRPTVAVPAVMVSTAMQGGCVCENAPYLRIGVNNVAIAALFAPKPLAVTAANDWTREIETKGLPELKQVWGLYGCENLVAASAFPQFGHNYNLPARQVMYSWFARAFELELDDPTTERDFVPIPLADLEIFDKEHPIPADAGTVEDVRASWTATNQSEFARLLPEDADGVANYRRVVGAAARVMLDEGCGPSDVEVAEPVQEVIRGVTLIKTTIGRAEQGEQIPLVILRPDEFRNRAVLWIAEAGKQRLFDATGPIPAVRTLLDAGFAVCSADVLGIGEFAAEGTAFGLSLDERYAGYTTAYNRPLLSQRVRDVATSLAALPQLLGELRSTDVVGTERAGLWVLLARAVSETTIRRTFAELAGFGFSKLESVEDPRFLPGALKYGGVGGIAALAAPAELFLAGVEGVPEAELAPLLRLNTLAGGGIEGSPTSLAYDEIAAWVLQ